MGSPPDRIGNRRGRRVPSVDVPPLGPALANRLFGAAVGTPFECPESVVSTAAAGASELLFPTLASSQAGLPAEFKHITKRRKRNQKGFL